MAARLVRPTRGRLPTTDLATPVSDDDRADVIVAAVAGEIAGVETGSGEGGMYADRLHEDRLDDDLPETGPLRRCIVSRAVLPKERMIRFVLGPDRVVVPDLAAKLPGRGMWLSASADVILSSGSSGNEMTSEPAVPGLVGRVDGPLGGQVDSLGAARQGASQGEGNRDSRRSNENSARGKPAGSRGGLTTDKLLVRAFSRAARGPVTLPPDLPGLLCLGLRQRITASLGLARRAGQAVAGFEKAREMVAAGRAGLVVQAADGSTSERARFLSSVGGGRAAKLAVIDPLPGADLGRVFGRDLAVHVAVAPGRLAESLVVDAGRLAGLTKRSTGTTEPPAPVNEVVGTDD